MARVSCSSLQPREWVKGKVIGSGSHGAVHLAMNKATGALFVVKSAHSESAVQALEDEADILESLSSPYIVQCLGRNASTGSNGESKVSVFMEYMAGGSLSDVAEKFGGSLEEEVVRLYTREILHGLKYLHENGIVHSDLKCKNVLLGASGNVKLGDFGFARRVKDGNLEELSGKSIGGTPLWMAPEVLRKEGLDFAADIWSLGCTVIEMATGRPPYGDEMSNPMAMVLKIACGKEKPQFPRRFCEEGLEFLAKCLEISPAKRWTAEELLNHPFISQGLQKKRACSPASVLDIGSYDEGADDASDESKSSPDEVMYRCRNPFSHFDDRTRKVRRQQHQAGWEFGSSEDWITVRSY